MRVTITGASGLIGTKLSAALQARGDEVIPRLPARRVARSRSATSSCTSRARTSPSAGRTRAASASRSHAWKARAASSKPSTHAETRPTALISSSAVGYYGKHGDEQLDESTPPGDDFLARVCVAWEHEAQQAETRVVLVRTGVVLDKSAGALAKMLLPFKLGVGGPVAGGDQYMPWIHVDDVVGIYLAAIDDARWTGPVNATAPEPVTNKEFSRALGRALHRPAIAPIPGFAIRTLYGDMAEIVTEGQRAVPKRTLALGYQFSYTDLEDALKKATSAPD